MIDEYKYWLGKIRSRLRRALVIVKSFLFVQDFVLLILRAVQGLHVQTVQTNEKTTIS